MICNTGWFQTTWFTVLTQAVLCAVEVKPVILLHHEHTFAFDVHHRVTNCMPRESRPEPLAQCMAMVHSSTGQVFSATVLEQQICNVGDQTPYAISESVVTLCTRYRTLCRLSEFSPVLAEALC